jgi:hypothetical protein
MGMRACTTFKRGVQLCQCCASADVHFLTLRCRFAAIDAAKFDDHKDKAVMNQISRDFMQHDLDKAFVGFSGTVRVRLCTLLVRAECFWDRLCSCLFLSRP